jgi:hypothetical protein
MGGKEEENGIHVREFMKKSYFNFIKNLKWIKNLTWFVSWE